MIFTPHPSFSSLSPLVHIHDSLCPLELLRSPFHNQHISSNFELSLNRVLLSYNKYIKKWFSVLGADRARRTFSVLNLYLKLYYFSVKNLLIFTERSRD